MFDNKNSKKKQKDDNSNESYTKKKKMTKSVYKKELLQQDFLSVEEMCNKFDGKNFF